MPGVARAPAPGGLFFCKYDRAFWLAGVAQFQRHSIGRIHFEKMMDALAKQAAFQALAKHVRSKNVRDLLQKISGVLLAFYTHAELAQAGDPSPDCRTRHANLSGDAGAANDDGGVFGEQR